MKNISKILWGMVLIFVGIIFGLNALGFTSIDIFFDGWWTLFIIVPSFIHLCEKKNEGSLVGLIVGIVLLLACQGFISFELIAKLIIPFILVMIGVSIIWGSVSSSEVKEKVEANKNENPDVFTAVFSEEKRTVKDNFKSNVVDVVFGHAVLDLKEAKIEDFATIKASAIFGAVDILIPENFTVKIKSTKVFGGVENTRSTTHTSNKKKKENTIYIDATSVFGSVNIK